MASRQGTLTDAGDSVIFDVRPVARFGLNPISVWAFTADAGGDVDVDLSPTVDSDVWVNILTLSPTVGTPAQDVVTLPAERMRFTTKVGFTGTVNVYIVAGR